MTNLFIGLAAGIMLACTVGYVILHFRVLCPMKKLTRMTKQLDELNAEELRLLAESIGGLPAEAARAIADYTETPTGSYAKKASSPEAEEAYRLHVADEISRSLLPQVLKENSASMTLDLAADLQKGARKNCDFYDYFFLDDNTLCLVIGQVPGFGISEALFAVVAQTTIRSRLRMGRSLVETMSDVNDQLYDLGGHKEVYVLVAAMNTLNGRFTFVNAGGPMPFLMRSEERYEWLKTPVYAPIGANESITYRSEVLRLAQGDRLFLYTGDLGEMANHEGELFRERELQATLNRSRSKTRSAEERIRFIQDEAAAFCESGDDVVGAASITLEYLKGSSDYIFTVVPGTPEHAPEITEFMRKTLEDGGIPPKERAKHILLTDELFSLCCRVCDKGADIKLECAIRSDDNALLLRMFAPMGGKDPLYSDGSGAGGNAANYIRTHTRSATFESGIERDMIMLVSDLN